MNFDERKRVASECLADFLADYAPPRGLDPAQLAKRITHTADAFARRMPTDGDYREKVNAVLMRIRDTHESNSWPPQAAFVMAMPKLEIKGVAPRTYQADDDRIPRLMSQGLPVPETQVWKNQDVSREVLDRYRFASVQGWLDVYRHEAKELMAARYGGVVLSYFMEAAE